MGGSGPSDDGSNPSRAIVYLFSFVYMVLVSAPGKVILFGEHAVVYSRPAIAMAIDKRVYVETDFAENRRSSLPCGLRLHCDLSKSSIMEDRIEEHFVFLPSSIGLDGSVSNQRFEAHKSKIFDEEPKVFRDNQYIKESVNLVLKKAEEIGETEFKDCKIDIKIKSELPISSGLGSSGALSVALIRSLSSLLGLDLANEEIAKMGWEVERNVQGFASGIDPFVSTYGGIIYYKDGRFEKMVIDGLIDLSFLIIHSGKNSSTKEMVKRVAELKTRFPHAINKIFDAIGAITEEAVNTINDLKKGELLKRSAGLEDLQSLGSLMSINQGLLESLGVSTPELSRLFYESLKYGALGAKLTGSGGGGCLISLYPPENDIGTISQTPKSVIYDYFKDYTRLECKISPTGVRIE